MINYQTRITHNALPGLSAKGIARAARGVRRAGFAARRFSVPPTPVDTGDLRNRVSLVLTNGGLTASLQWQMFYGIYHELGTRRGIKAKHFARTGVQMAQPQFYKDMAEAYGGTEV